MILTELTVATEEFTRHSGWKLEPEGLCRGDRCIPLPEGGDGPLDARVLADRLQAPLVHDADADVWALGPSTTGRALDSAELPDLVLPDLRTGEPFDVGTLRGRRVLLLAWASW